MTELFKEFQEFRKILCVCPCCGEIKRVSDLRLKAKGPAPRTWLDDFEKQLLAMERKEERFDEREEKLREIAREKGRKDAAKVINQAISPAFKALKYDPFDVKPVLNPIDFLVFKGMNKNESVSNVIFLSKQCSNTILNTLRKQVKTAVEKKKYEWQVARIDDMGDIKFE